MVNTALNQGLADELEQRGYHIRRFPSFFHIMDKPWNEVDNDIALLYSIHAQDDGYLIADHTKYSEDAKPTHLVPYDVPDMLERILRILGE